MENDIKKIQSWRDCTIEKVEISEDSGYSGYKWIIPALVRWII